VVVNKAKHDIAQAIIIQNILVQIKVKSPKLFAKIQRDYKEALEDGSGFNPVKSLIQIMES